MHADVFTPHDFSSSFVLCSHSRFEELIALLVRQFSFCALVSIHTHTLVLLGCRRRVCGSASHLVFGPAPFVVDMFRLSSQRVDVARFAWPSRSGASPMFCFRRLVEVVLFV